jgi:hypothetical protein
LVHQCNIGLPGLDAAQRLLLKDVQDIDDSGVGSARPKKEMKIAADD